MPLSISQTLHNNRYRIVKLIGEGGFGAVYRAWDTSINQPVAVKENLDTTDEAKTQFLQEAQMMGGLRHPNLPRVSDYFFLPGQGQYLVMDFVEGDSLADLLEMRQGQPFSEAEVLPWLQQVCAALDYLHNLPSPIIHRDIKPENIIITPEGQAMLVDFGISKVYDRQAATVQGARAVTPGYSPAEQYGGKTDARSDVYALGATLYRVLTGEEPLPSVDIVAGAQLTPPRQHNREIQGVTEQVILKAMSRNKSQRYESANALLAALDSPPSVLDSPPHSAGNINWRVAVGVVLLILLLVLAFALGRGEILIPDEASTPTTTPTTVPTRVSSIDGMVQVYINAGEFTMGSENGKSDEAPPHIVSLDAYWIDQTEVTNAQFAQFVDETGYETAAEQQGGGITWSTENEEWGFLEGATWQAPYGPDSNLDGLNDHPVVLVSWDDAGAYCEWANRRLPTEAQWEKAARGIIPRTYPWGDETSCQRVNFDDETLHDSDVFLDGENCDGFIFTAPVGSFPTGASPYGVLDMAGNVWEWVADWYDGNYYQNSSAQNPQGPLSGETRVLRGGAWPTSDDSFGITFRSKSTPNSRNSNIGFRCVQE